MMDLFCRQMEFIETRQREGNKGEGEREREREERECDVFKIPCEECVISQAKCEWLTGMGEAGESRP